MDTAHGQRLRLIVISKVKMMDLFKYLPISCISILSFKERTYRSVSTTHSLDPAGSHRRLLLLLHNVYYLG